MDKTKPDPHRFAPDKMHDPREAIHFVAAQELMIHGKLNPETVELLCLLAPHPLTQYVPPSDGQTHGTLTVAFAGSGSVMSKDIPIDAAADAASGGQVQAKAEDEVTMQIADAMRSRLRQQINQRNQAVAEHMKKVRERQKRLN
jgi:hypothetical protein